MRLAIIPARGGSKGVPGKNLAIVAGETLTARAIRCALDSHMFQTVLLATDDEAIAREGLAAGAVVPFLRSPELAADSSNILDAVLDVLCRLGLDGYPRFETIALIEPTSPMRTLNVVSQTVRAAEEAGVDAAFTVSPVPPKFHALKQFTLKADGLGVQLVVAGTDVVNRQELPQAFIRNGLCYAAKRSALETGLGFTRGQVRLIVCDGPVINIDEPEDLNSARQFLG